MLMLAASPQQAPPATSAQPVPASEGRVCRRVQTTGSVLAKRTCMTRAEWAKLQQSTEGAWEEARGKRGFMSRSPTDAD